MHRGFHDQLHVARCLLGQKIQTLFGGEHAHPVEQGPLGLNAGRQRLGLRSDGQKGGWVFRLICDIAASTHAPTDARKGARGPPSIVECGSLLVDQGHLNPKVSFQGERHSFFPEQVGGLRRLGLHIHGRQPQAQGKAHRGPRSKFGAHATLLSHCGLRGFPTQPITPFHPHPGPVQRIDPKEINREQNQNHNRDEEQTKSHRDRHGDQELRLKTLVEHQRCQTCHCGDRSQQDGTKTAHSRFPYRLTHLQTIPQIVVECRHKDKCVVHQNAHQGNATQETEQANLGPQKPMAQADPNQSKGNEAKHCDPLQGASEGQNDDEEHQCKNERHDGLDAGLALGLFPVLSLVTGTDGWVFGQDLGKDIVLDVCIGIACTDTRSRQVGTHLNLTFSIQSVDGGDALHLPHVCHLFQRHQIAIRGPYSVAHQVAQGCTVLFCQAHPNPNLVSPTLKPLDLTPKETLAHLRHDVGGGQPQLTGTRMGQNLQLLQSTLVVVGDIFQVFSQHHGRLQFLCGHGKVFQVAPQERHRHRPSKRRETCEAQVFSTIHGAHLFPKHRTDVRAALGPSLPIQELNVDAPSMGIGTNAFVHSQNHLQAVLSLCAQGLVDLPNRSLDVVQFAPRDFLSRSTCHGQTHRQIVGFDEGKKGGLDQATSNQSRHTDEKECDNGRKGHPWLVQGEAENRSVNLALETLHQVAHGALHLVGFPVSPERLAVAHVRRQNEGPFDQTENQGQHDDRGHVPKEIAQLSFDEKERCEGHHGGDNGRKNRRQNFHGAVDGRRVLVLAHLKMPVDVLCNHNPIVHKNPDHQNHSKQADDVDGHPCHAGKNEHAGEGHWDGQSHPKGQTNVQEQRQQNHHQQKANHPIVHEQINALVQHHRTVPDDVEVKTRPHLLGLFVVGRDVIPRQFRHLQNALRGEVVHGHDHRRLSIVPASGRIVVRPSVMDLRHVRQSNHLAVEVGTDHDVLQGLRVVATETSANNPLLAVRFQTPSCGLYVGRPDCPGHLRQGHVQLGQSIGKDGHFHFFSWKTTEIHLADALQGAQVLFNSTGLPLQSAQVLCPSDGKGHCHTDGFLLEHSGRFHAHRKGGNAVHSVLDILQNVIGF